MSKTNVVLRDISPIMQKFRDFLLGVSMNRFVLVHYVTEKVSVNSCIVCYFRGSILTRCASSHCWRIGLSPRHRSLVDLLTSKYKI